MKQGWRWFGKSDPISLREIRQAGATDVVSSLYGRKCGEAWPVEEILACRRQVESAGMEWSVAESLPVHESIKKREPGCGRYLEIYAENLRRLASCGVKVACFNFMPVTDWVRTETAFSLDDGSEVSEFDEVKLAAFDLCILRREGAERDYSASAAAAARDWFAAASEPERRRLRDTVLMGLPGTVDDLSLDQFRAALAAYRRIDGRRLRENLYAFLDEMRPVCDETGISLAIHPDDPPRPLFGLPRVMGCAADIREMFARVPSGSVGLAFCSGSLGGDPANDEVAIFREFAPRIHFAHFRNLVYTGPRTFRESASHLAGKVDMPALMDALLEEENRRGGEIVLRPDHGRRMDVDKSRAPCYPGYSYGGRLAGLSELRGLECGIRYRRRHCPVG